MSNRKYTIEEVKSLFEKRGYLLLEEEYVNAHTKMKYICPNHSEHIQEITFSRFKNLGNGCWYCSYEKRGANLKIPFAEVKKAFDDRGYTLVSKVYKGKHEKLEYICPNHPDKIQEISFHSFTNQNAGCSYCAGNMKLEFEIVKKVFEQKGYELLESEYKNAQTPMKYKCPVHKTVNAIRYSDLRSGQGCPQCGIKKRSGESHPLWNGGISSLEDVLRHSISGWKKRILTQYNFKCFITGETENLVVHHVRNFNEVVIESIKELNLEIHDSVNKYTDTEIKALIEKVVNKHDSVNGVPLSKEIHIAFHKRYGYKNNNAEQLNEFKRIYQLQSSAI